MTTKYVSRVIQVSKDTIILVIQYSSKYYSIPTSNNLRLGNAGEDYA